MGNAHVQAACTKARTRCGPNRDTSPSCGPGRRTRTGCPKPASAQAAVRPDTTECRSTCACRPALGRCKLGRQRRLAPCTAKLSEHEAHNALGMHATQFDAN